MSMPDKHPEEISKEDRDRIIDLFTKGKGDRDKSCCASIGRASPGSKAASLSPRTPPG